MIGFLKACIPPKAPIPGPPPRNPFANMLFKFPDLE